jgi:heme/copper-type cytochrome/quinol oxidase subunit 1
VTLTRSFAIEAAALLVLSFFSGRFLTSGLDIQLHDTYFVLSPKSVCLAMAAILCVSAAAYSIFPVNPRGASWHFWLTTIGITAFWICFYFFGRMVSQGAGAASINSSAGIATLSALVLSIFVITLSVVIFAVSFGVALIRRQSASH